MNADELLAKVKVESALPSVNVDEDQVILDRINDELTSVVTLFIEANRQEFFTDSLDIQLLATQSAYTMPERAIANTTRVIKYVDASGVERGGPLPQTSLSDVSDAGLGCNPVAFYLVASDICPLPRPGSSTTGKLRVYYARRPSALVLDLLDGNSRHTQVGTIANVAVAGGNSTITLAAAHSGFPAGKTIDIQAARSPFKLLAKDVLVSAAAVGLTIVCNGVDLTAIGLTAGDYVTLAKTSYVPMLPQEAHSALRDFACARTLMVSNLNRAQALQQEAATRMKAFLRVAEPRTNQAPKPISAWRGWRGRG